MSKMPITREQRFVAKALDAIVRWTPLGLSTGLLFHFVNNQGWIGVAATFPIAVVTGAWAAYTKSFVSATNVWAGDRGNKDAQTIIQAVEQTNKALKNRFTNANSRFAQAQGRACRDYLVEGLGEARLGLVPELNEVYVPLVLQSGASGEEFAMLGSKPAGEDCEETQIWDLLQQVKKNTSLRRMAIIAQGGFGKTTLLRSVAYRYGLELRETCREKQVPPLIPILLYLREHQNIVSQSSAPDLPTLIVKHVLPKLPGKSLALDNDWAKTLLQSGQAIVMMDGFDEVAADNCEAVSQWIDEAIRRYGETTIFVLSSRPVGYARYIGQVSWMPASVRAFGKGQRNDFLRRWYLCQTKIVRPGRDVEEVEERAKQFSDDLIQQIDQRKALSRLADNPLMLVMIATYHRYNPSGQLPIGRQRLYQGFINLLLEDRPASKGIQLALPKEEGQLVLQNVALKMVQESRTELSKTEMARWVHQVIESYGAQLSGYVVDISRWLEQLEEVSELLVRKASAENYEFAHRSFQEYLAAAEVKRRRAPELLLSLKPEWRDTVVMYSTQTNPTDLIEKLCDKADPASLDIAYDCCLEYGANRAKVHSQAFDQIKELQYQQLEKSLSERDWKTADERTYRIMLQALRKRYGDYFRKEELLNFPCKDLLRMDALWINYSDGNLGFSVQKEIYVLCDGLLDGKYHRKPYAQFFQAVGWCKDVEDSDDARVYEDIREIVEDDMVRSYEDLTSEIIPPKGSFPDMDLCATNGGGLICSLAFRLEKCAFTSLM